MPKTTLALAAAALFSGATHAAPATRFKEAFDGVGHMLVVPYYTVQGGNATLLNIVNTDKVNGKAVKVRFRGAANADTVYDFTLFLSPGDVWAAEISQNPATGLARLNTVDNSCTLPSLVSVDFNTARLNPQADRVNETREGYIDIIAMADIVPGTAVYSATKHVKGLPPGACNQNVTYPPNQPGVCIPPAPCNYGPPPIPAALKNLQTEAAIAAAGFGAPTTGLLANWSIFNVAEATSWSGKATAIAAVDAEGKPGAGNMVVKPQTADAPTGAAVNLTADPLLRSGVVQLVQSDLPDLSTPYIGQITPVQQAAQLSEVLAKASVYNEYFTDEAVQAGTDWVFNLPTMRYAVALNHATGLRAYTVLSPEYFNEGNTVLLGPQSAPKVCLNKQVHRFWDRNEQEFVGQWDDGIMWPVPRGAGFCGPTIVWSINAGTLGFGASVLGATVLRQYLFVESSDGRGKLTFTDLNPVGIPVIGAAFSKATSTNIGAGVSGNFGLVWEHRYTRPGDVIP